MERQQNKLLLLWDQDGAIPRVLFGRNRGKKKAVVVVIYSRDFGATRLVLWQDLASWLVEPVSMISVVA